MNKLSYKADAMKYLHDQMEEALNYLLNGYNGKARIELQRAMSRANKMGREKMTPMMRRFIAKIEETLMHIRGNRRARAQECMEKSLEKLEKIRPHLKNKRTPPWSLRKTWTYSMSKEQWKKIGEKAGWIKKKEIGVMELPPSKRSFIMIKNELDPDGKNHDLTLRCVLCGTTETCRCRKKKRNFDGVCFDCWEK